MAKKKQSLKRTVNEALRVGLSRPDAQQEKPFKVKPHACHFMPGIDIYKLGQLADQLEAEETMRKLYSGFASG